MSRGFPANKVLYILSPKYIKLRILLHLNAYAKLFLDIKISRYIVLGFRMILMNSFLGTKE